MFPAAKSGGQPSPQESPGQPPSWSPFPGGPHPRTGNPASGVSPEVNPPAGVRGRDTHSGPGWAPARACVLVILLAPALLRPRPEGARSALDAKQPHVIGTREEVARAGLGCLWA